MDPARIEKAFLVLTGAVLVLFLGALFYAAWGMGLHLPGRAGRVDPAAVRRTPPFDHPGVRATGDGRYEVVLLGQAWTFVPREIHVPRGATVTFKATSADVVHGLDIVGTRINVMLVPGQITEVTYTFDRPGEYLMLCHEYCGVGHHLMSGKVVVQ